MNALVIVPVDASFAWERLRSLAEADVLLVLADSLPTNPSPADFTGMIRWADAAFRTHYLPAYARGDLFASSLNGLRNFGLYYAWKEGYDLAVMLDGSCDTRPTPSFLNHVPVGRIVTVDRIRTSSHWFNPLWQLHSLSSHLYARGYPYEWRTQDFPSFTSTRPVLSKFNQGLWLGDPDIAGIDKLQRPCEGYVLNERPELFCRQVVLCKSQHLPLSAANFQTLTDLIPALYFFLDDVAAMYILKAFMDMRGDLATVGEPLVARPVHLPVRETLEQHQHQLLQPIFTDAVDHALRYVHADTYLEMGRALGAALGRQGEHLAGLWGQLVRTYASRLIWWTRLFCK